jgi:16S rRNA (uracil1498-N3)-methyltransferase
MYRFFVSPEQLEVDAHGQVRAAHITASEAAHAARVLRLQTGTQVVVCDGTGMEYLAVLEKVTPTHCHAQVTEQRMCPAEPGISVCLMQGLAKGDKMDWIVQKSVELGVTAVFPVQTAYSVVRLDAAKAKGRVERWRKIAQEAAKQCGRAVPPHIYAPAPLSVAVEQVRARHLLIPWENAVLPLRTALQQELHREKTAGAVPQAASPYDFGIVIGPEGGLPSEEVQPLSAHGAVAVTLGSRILRTETAAIATLTAVLYELGEFGDNRSLTEWR